MKVLLDANVAREFEALLTDALEDTDVVHSVDLGWERKHNGELQQAGLAAGFTHLVTHDKSMADEHYPHLPVLALDDPGQGEDGGGQTTFRPTKSGPCTLRRRRRRRMCCAETRPRNQGTESWYQTTSRARRYNA